RARMHCMLSGASGGHRPSSVPGLAAVVPPHSSHCRILIACIPFGPLDLQAIMTPLEFSLIAFAVAIGAGLLGSLLGLGGGIIIIPALTLLLKIDIRYAIGASVISVIATSSGAAAAYVRERMTNIRVAMLLEIATTAGALTGAYLAGLISTRWLYI